MLAPMVLIANTPGLCLAKVKVITNDMEGAACDIQPRYWCATGGGLISGWYISLSLE